MPSGRLSVPWMGSRQACCSLETLTAVSSPHKWNTGTRHGSIFATNEGPLTGTEGGALHRVDVSGHTLILNADHPDKAAYPTRTFHIKAADLPAILVGEVVWFSRYLGIGKRR